MIQTSQLISIGIVTIITVLSVYMWMDRWDLITKGIPTTRNTEGFINYSFDGPDMDTALTDDQIYKLTKRMEKAPTYDDAVQAHQTLLRFIRNDFSQGIKFVQDFGRRFYGDNLPLRSDLDTRTLLNNYMPP